MTVNEWKEDFMGYINELNMPRDDYNIIIDYIADGCALLKEQEAVIEKYRKADGFLAAHGWKWDGGEVK